MKTITDEAYKLIEDALKSEYIANSGAWIYQQRVALAALRSAPEVSGEPECEHCCGTGKILIYGREESWEENCNHCNAAPQSAVPLTRAQCPDCGAGLMIEQYLEPQSAQAADELFNEWYGNGEGLGVHSKTAIRAAFDVGYSKAPQSAEPTSYMDGYEAAKNDCRDAYDTLREQNKMLLEALEEIQNTDGANARAVARAALSALRAQPDHSELVKRLRSAIVEVRRKSYPLSDLIPMIAKAADALEGKT